MRIDTLLRRDCITSCPPTECTCNNQTEDCVIIAKTCTQCAQIRCDPKPQAQLSNSSSGGVSKGALAGAVVGVLIFLGIAVGLFLWYRRNQRRKAASAPQVKTDVPAAAEDVLKRPDPTEKHDSMPTELNTVRVYSTSSNTTIDLDPESQSSHHTAAHTASRNSVKSDPFSDSHSIETTGTEGTNVIPIALVSPESHSLRSEESSASSPVRPARTPEMDLNLDHVNISHDSLRTPGTGKYAPSQRSGVSAVSRNSYLSSASYSSDFLNEAPMVVTANKGHVGQVLGVMRAEMVSAGSLTPNSAESMKTQMNKPPVRSPLAATSFGPSDTLSVSELSEDGSDPFADQYSSNRTTLDPTSASAATTTFDSPHSSISPNWTPTGPALPWTKGDSKGGNTDSRPSSISTQAGSVIDIASATRVNVGLGHLSPPSTAGTPRSPYRTTMGRLVSPQTGDSTTFEEQQQLALAHAQAQAQAQGLDNNTRRISGSSVMSSASTRADSILESFPFVPPSPISDRPMRSPLTQTFTGPSSPSAQQTVHVVPPSPSSQYTPQTQLYRHEDEDALPAPPNRRTLGLSTGSQLSTASSGLGSFPFQIDNGARDSTDVAPTAFGNTGGRQRASLDTLAITSDLSSYPLAFDRDSNVPPLPRV